MGACSKRVVRVSISLSDAVFDFMLDYSKGD